MEFSGQEDEWVAIPFSRRSSWPRDRTQVSHIAGRFFTVWATGKPTSRFKLYQFWTMFIVPQMLFLSSDCNVFFWGSNSTHSRFTTSFTSSRKPSSISITTSVLHKLLYESLLNCKTIFFVFSGLSTWVEIHKLNKHLWNWAIVHFEATPFMISQTSLQPSWIFAPG